MFAMYYTHVANVRDDILSGLTVALALVPEAVAFAFVAGVEPITGLYAAFMVGLITSLIGGRSGMISGATGSLAVVMVALVADHGVEYLFATVVLMGVLQIAFGICKFGKFIRMVPYPVMLGFVNGLAIIIFLAQLKQFKFEENGVERWLPSNELSIMLLLIALTIAIMHYLPKITRSIPSGLAAIIVVSLLVMFADLKTRTVGDIASIAGAFPPFHLPIVPMNLETLYIILPYSMILAAIGLIESLLTMSVIDDMTDTRGHGNRVCIGQGSANIVTGMFSGMGGCAMIGQSMINISSGGLRNLSGIAAALFLLSFILFASGLIEVIPLAALIGIMFMVVLGTFEWGSFRLLKRIPIEDSFVGILVTVVTVVTDLAIAVIVGVIATALIFAWKQARHVYSEISTEGKIRVYKVHGPLFFASAHHFTNLFDPEGDPDNVIIDFAHSRVADHSAIEAIDNLAERYRNAGKSLHLRHLSKECRDLLKKAGDVVEVNISEDPHYHVADDNLA
ncbi:MAG: SulP family inorganic anion transporter [Mariprofundales bacterium]